MAADDVPGTRPRIRIHLGHTKCGSTSIQHFLAENRERLAQQGYLLPASTKVGVADQALSAHVGLERCLRNYARERDLGTLDAEAFERHFVPAFIDEIDRSDAHTVVLSHEGLFPRSAEAMARLKALLDRVSDDVRALVVIRRQDRWAISSYNTRLMAHGTASGDMLTTDAGRVHGLRYARQLDLWADVLGADALDIVAFEDHADIIEPFAGFIGHDPSGLTRVRRNPGMSAYAQEVLRVHNAMREREGRPAGEAGHPENDLRKRMRKILPVGEPQLPAALDVEAHLAHFAADNERLKGRYLLPDSRFFDDAGAHPEERTAVSVSETEVADWVARARIGESDLPATRHEREASACEAR